MKVIIALIAVLFEGFFSGMETALVSCDKVKLRTLVERGDRKARLVWQLLKGIHRVLGTTLVGTNISVVLGSSFATAFFIEVFGRLGPVVATIFMVPLTVIFGELLPKTFSRRFPDKVIFYSIRPFYMVYKFLYPVVSIVTLFSGWFSHLFGAREKKEEIFLSKEDLKLLVQEVADEGVLEEQEEETIQRIFEFSDIRVNDIMVHRQDIVFVDVNDSKDVILKKARESGYTRFPVFRGTEVIGSLNIFDLFYYDDDWHNHIRPIRKVYPSQMVYTLFFQMQLNKESMAVVVRKGKVVGLVSIEDIMKEVIRGEEG